MRDRVTIVYYDYSGKIAEENLWVEPIGEYFKIDNIPFFAPNLAVNDIISIEDDNGILYFDSLIKPSGHSTLQVIFYNEEDAVSVIKEIERLDCKWEGMKNQPYFAIDVPSNIDYGVIKNVLDEKCRKNILDYKESCLSENHRPE